MSPRDEIFRQLQRGLPGTFLWRARAGANGEYEEELLSENAVFHVADGSIYVKPRSQPAYFLSHNNIVQSKQMHLLIGRSKGEDPPIRFVFENERGSLCHDEVEAAAIHILIWDKKEQIKPTSLLFLLWTEGNRTRGTFLGGSQQRLIDYATGVLNLLGIRGGDVHCG